MCVRLTSRISSQLGHPCVKKSFVDCKMEQTRQARSSALPDLGGIVLFFFVGGSATESMNTCEKRRVIFNLEWSSSPVAVGLA